MIQNIVSRLSQNSYLLKGWSVLLISAMFALAANDTEILFIYLAYFPAICFWVLDGYFLHQERMYRKLYDKVSLLSDQDIDYSMNIEFARSQVVSWERVCVSKTVLLFHGVIIGAIILVTLVSILQK